MSVKGKTIKETKTCPVCLHDTLDMQVPICLYCGYTFGSRVLTTTSLNLINQLVEEKPGDAVRWLCKGRILYDCRQLKEALKAINNALFIDPHCSRSLCEKAAVLSELNKNGEALKYCTRSLKINPHYGRALILMSYIHESLGNHKEAKLYEKKAMVKLNNLWKRMIAVHNRFKKTQGRSVLRRSNK
jgi:tetratricopeptide (TPR) repeat protein